MSHSKKLQELVKLVAEQKKLAELIQQYFGRTQSVQQRQQSCVDVKKSWLERLRLFQQDQELR